jgi:LSD1 subclass zinc finger protein
MTQTLHACERCATPIEKGDLRCAVCALGIPTDKALPVGDVFAKILRCGGCGAATAYDADARAVRCAFCTTELSLEEVRDPQEEVKQWMGFTVDRDAAVKALKNWLGRQGFFRPADMGSKAKVDDLQPLYFPAWMFDAEAEVSWAADSNLGSRRSAWAPHAGSTNITFDDVLVSASRGLNPKETSALLGTYAGGGLDSQPTSAAEVGVESIHNETFDAQRSFARAYLLHGIKQRAREHVEHNCVPGSRVRKVGVSMRIEGLHTRRVALPVWVLAWRYNDQVYRAVISGRDPSGVHGRLPLSWARIGLVVGGLVLILFVIALIASLG